MVMADANNLKDDEKIFLICDQCLWNATCVNKLHLQHLLGTNYLCPVCKQDQLSSFSVKPDNPLKFTYPDETALRLTFEIKK